MKSGASIVVPGGSTQIPSFDQLVRVIASRGADGRSITAIAGPPGSGKSTVAENLANELNRRQPGSAVVLPMDGFHLDDSILITRDLRQRKGAPETFDFGGLASILSRLRTNEEVEIAVPVFDRRIELSRAGARMIPRFVRHVVVEGNYLFLNSEPWRRLYQFFDTTVALALSESVLRDRLMARWAALGFDEAEILAKVQGNDLPNARLVRQSSRPPEFILPGDIAG